MSWRAKWQTVAFDHTCTIDTGSAASAGGSSYADLPCMEVPPTEFEDDTILKLFLEDTADRYQIGHRVIYESIRYLITRIQRDDTYKLLMLTSWSETL